MPKSKQIVSNWIAFIKFCDERNIELNSWQKEVAMKFMITNTGDNPIQLLRILNSFHEYVGIK